MKKTNENGRGAMKTRESKGHLFKSPFSMFFLTVFKKKKNRFAFKFSIGRLSCRRSGLFKLKGKC